MNRDNLDDILVNYAEILHRDEILNQEIASISDRISKRIKVCENTMQILDNATVEFNNLTSILNKKDIPFFVFSVLLQGCIKYVIKVLREISDKEIAKRTPFHQDEKSNRQGTLYYTSREEIISNPVPFDAIQKEHNNKWYKDNNKNNEIAEQIKGTVVVEEKSEDKEEYTIDFNKLKEQNKETVAWIKVNNTNIEYPVLKADNNNFYLNHSFDRSKNSAGWIFADYRNKIDNTDKNIVIYGHNMRDGSMFGSMKNILNSDWYENEKNTNITLYTENEKCIYKVFSIYKIESEDYYIKTGFNNDDDFEKFIKTIKARSIKEFNVDCLKNDSILTLSTCSNNNKYRVVLHAKKI